MITPLKYYPPAGDLPPATHQNRTPPAWIDRPSSVGKAVAVQRRQTNPYVTDVARRKYSCGDPVADGARTHAALYDRDAKFREGRKKQMKESLQDSSAAQTRKMEKKAIARQMKYSRCMCRLVAPYCAACEAAGCSSLKGRQLYQAWQKGAVISVNNHELPRAQSTV